MNPDTPYLIVLFSCIIMAFIAGMIWEKGRSLKKRIKEIKEAAINPAPMINFSEMGPDVFDSPRIKDEINDEYPLWGRNIYTDGDGKFTVHYPDQLIFKAPDGTIRVEDKNPDDLKDVNI